MYIYVDWFVETPAAAEPAAAGETSVAASKENTLANAHETLRFVWDVLYAEFRDVYEAVRERLRVHRGRVYEAAQSRQP
jgi:hypothetical protein